MAGQLVQQAIEQSVLRVAKQLEDQLDDEMHKLDNMQDDDLERIRQRRILDLKKQQERTKEWIAKGHGEYRELQDEKEFFKEMKGEARMICHFYRDSWPCKVCTAVWEQDPPQQYTSACLGTSAALEIYQEAAVTCVMVQPAAVCSSVLQHVGWYAALSSSQYRSMGQAPHC